MTLLRLQLALEVSVESMQYPRSPCMNNFSSNGLWTHARTITHSLSGNRVGDICASDSTRTKPAEGKTERSFHYLIRCLVLVLLLWSLFHVMNYGEDLQTYLWLLLFHRALEYSYQIVIHPTRVITSSARIVALSLSFHAWVGWKDNGEEELGSEKMRKGETERWKDRRVSRFKERITRKRN